MTKAEREAFMARLRTREDFLWRYPDEKTRNNNKESTK